MLDNTEKNVEQEANQISEVNENLHVNERVTRSRTGKVQPVYYNEGQILYLIRKMMDTLYIDCHYDVNET